MSIHLADIAPPWKAISALAALGLTVDRLCRHLSARGTHYVGRAVLLADGRWMVFGGSDEAVSARLCAAWGASMGPVVALEWRCADGRRRQAWLLRRDLAPDVWRRLRVRLRLS